MYCRSGASGGWRESSAGALDHRHQRELGSRDRSDIAVVVARLPGPLVADGTRAKVHKPTRWCGRSQPEPESRTPEASRTSLEKFFPYFVVSGGAPRRVRE